MKKMIFALVVVLVAAIYLAVELVDTRQELRQTRQELRQTRKELATTEFILDATREQEQIECFLRTSVAFYFDGKKKEAYRFLEYAIFKMDAKRNADLGMLPAKMLKDPRFAKKLGLTKLTKKGNVHRFGGG